MQTQQQIHEGMRVRAADGEALGKLVARGDESFTIEKGFFFPKEYVASYEEIAEIREDEIWLRQTKAELKHGGPAPAQYAMTDESSERNAAAGTAPEAMAGEAREELRVPLAEEDLHVEKRTKQAGEVVVHKDVVKEEKTIPVTVSHEEARVERVAASGAAPDASFREGETRIPLREEEIEVHKHPVVREEVRVSKQPHEERRDVTAQTRREEAEIEEKGEVKRER